MVGDVAQWHRKQVIVSGAEVAEPDADDVSGAAVSDGSEPDPEIGRSGEPGVIVVWG